MSSSLQDLSHTLKGNCCQSHCGLSVHQKSKESFCWWFRSSSSDLRLKLDISVIGRRDVSFSGKGKCFQWWMLRRAVNKLIYNMKTTGEEEKKSTCRIPKLWRLYWTFLSLQPLARPHSDLLNSGFVALFFKPDFFYMSQHVRTRRHETWRLGVRISSWHHQDHIEIRSFLMSRSWRRLPVVPGVFPWNIWRSLGSACFLPQAVLFTSFLPECFC